MTEQVEQQGPPELPSSLSILPTGSSVAFPFMVVPLVVRDERAVQLVTDAASGSRMMGLFSAADPEQPESSDNLAPLGTAVHILRLVRTPDGAIQLLVRGVARVRRLEITAQEPYMVATVEEVADVEVETTEVEALHRSLQALFVRIVGLSPTLPQEAADAALEIREPGRLADFVANALDLSHHLKLEILQAVDVTERLNRITELAVREEEVLQLGSEIQSRIRGDMDKNQREYYLREQLKQVQRELGELTGEKSETGQLRERLDGKGLPEAARAAVDEELARLEHVPPASPEYGIIRTYLDWIAALPWSDSTSDNHDLGEARRILDEDHYDLAKVKERILEYLAVHKLKGEVRGPILCFVGPPGVGKTSLGQSIARALNRHFVRISLGGVRDEAEIRGHRRTYIGALPGRIIQGLRRAGTNNPVFMLDEIDKLSVGFQGDPAAALLEVLDPAQNNAFSDHYLDVPFDLSKVLFIATANVLDTIPGPLRDRMEIMELSGYTEQEKLHIAQRYLVPRQIEENGLRPDQFSIDDGALKRVIEAYTREAGVRSLERQIGSIARKAALRIAEDDGGSVTVTAERVQDYLGPPRVHHEVVEQSDEVGVVTGLSVTQTGGDVLFVEATMVPGKGSLMLTGQLGEVMQESARAAMTYVRSRASSLGVPDDAFEKHDFHVHVPSGAIPKDGPSAGITMATALSSAVSGRKVDKDVAMTGEITLRGRVLPIGGLKDKVLAAHRAGVRTVLFPRDNEHDLDEIPPEVRNDLRLIPVENVDQVLAVALRPAEAAGKVRRSRRRDPVAAAGG